MSYIKVSIVNNTISVENDGKGIPIEESHADGMLIPSMIFGRLLAGDNFNDDNKRCAGGRNGYGAKLANIYSSEFILETQDTKNYFKQIWKNNMFEVGTPEVKEINKDWKA